MKQCTNSTCDAQSNLFHHYPGHCQGVQYIRLTRFTAHISMRRKSGEPYILHPLAVARIVVEEIGLGVTSAICALLHDVVEDTELSLDDIKREFGQNYAKLIDGLTKISNVVDLKADTTVQAENFRKILLTL